MQDPVKDVAAISEIICIDDEEEEVKASPDHTAEPVTPVPKRPRPAEDTPTAAPVKVPRDEKQEKRRKELISRATAARLKIDFHATWFPAHNYHAKKNHWGEFLTVLSSGNPLESCEELGCSTCKGIIEEHFPTDVKMEPIDDLDIKQTRGKMNGRVKSRFHSLKMQEGCDRRRGRPARPEENGCEPLQYNLLRWLDVKRPGKHLGVGTRWPTIHFHPFQVPFWILLVSFTNVFRHDPTCFLFPFITDSAGFPAGVLQLHCLDFVQRCGKHWGLKVCCLDLFGKCLLLNKWMVMDGSWMFMVYRYQLIASDSTKMHDT